MNCNKDLPDAPWIAHIERYGLQDSDPDLEESYKPERFSNNGITWWYGCGYCDKPIDVDERKCPFCGKGIKWDD